MLVIVTFRKYNIDFISLWIYLTLCLTMQNGLSCVGFKFKLVTFVTVQLTLSIQSWHYKCLMKMINLLIFYPALSTSQLFHSSNCQFFYGKFSKNLYCCTFQTWVLYPWVCRETTYLWIMKKYWSVFDVEFDENTTSIVCNLTYMFVS